MWENVRIHEIMSQTAILNIFKICVNVTPTTFYEISKSHISAQFFVREYVLGWYTYFETAQVLFSLCFREKGVKTLRIYE